MTQILRMLPIPKKAKDFRYKCAEVLHQRVTSLTKVFERRDIGMPRKGIIHTGKYNLVNLTKNR
jgi:hypothetical protein